MNIFVDVLRLVANHKLERVNYPTRKSYFKSKIEFLFGLQEVSILSPQCGISLGDALATQHVQGACGNLSCLFFFRTCLERKTIVKLVMCCYSASSSDSSAKTNQSALRLHVDLAVHRGRT